MSDMKRINLIPDIKQERNQRKRREAYTQMVAWVVIIGMGAGLLITGGAAFYQRQKLQSAKEGIQEERAAIESIEQREQLLGMQKALRHLPQLEREKLFVSNLPNVMEQVVPTRVQLKRIEYQRGGAMTINGEAQSYRDLYTFVDALRETEGTISSATGDGRTDRFFNSVTLDSASGGATVEFVLSTNFNESLISAKYLEEGTDEQ